MSTRRGLGLAVAAVALLLLAGRGVAASALEYQWYVSMGAGEVWRARALFTIATGGLTAVLGTLFVFVNLYAVRGSVVSLVLPRRVANLEIGEEVPSRYLLVGTAVLALVLGAVLTQSDWLGLAGLVYGAPFGESDPYFQRELQFFAYWLPLERSFYLWALLAVLLVTAVVIFLYALTPSLRWERGTLRVSQYVRRHLAALATLLLVLLAWSYRLDAFSLLGHGSGEGNAFSYVDHRVLVPASVLLSILTLTGALVVLWAGWTGQLRVALAAVSALLLLSLVLHQFAPALSRRFATQQDPVVRERPYLATRAAYTRRAFALERMVLDGDSALRVSAAPGRDVPLWDETALLRAVQRSRGTSIVPAAAEQALGDGTLAALVVSRGTGTDDWSAALLSLALADERGAPVVLDSRGAPSDDWSRLAPVLVVDSGDGYAIVADSAGRIAGAPMRDGIGRLLPAWALQNFRLLTQDLPHPSPRIMLRRNVREIVGAVAPFYEQGTRILPALRGDTLFWLIDLYTLAPDYPLSVRVSLGRRAYPYLRLVGLATVNATTGRTRLLTDSVAAPLDPIARGWRRAFPALHSDVRTLSPDLVGQIQPAIDQARVQRSAFAAVGHAREGAASRGLPQPDGSDTVFASSVARFADGRGALATSLPLVGADDRVDGLVVATGGAARAAYWVATPARARWISALDQLRSSDTSIGAAGRDVAVVRGPLRAVPWGGSAALVQTRYAWRPQGLVSLLGVGVVVDDSVRAGRTLRDIFGTVPSGANDQPAPTELRTRAAQLYDSLRAAQRRGDWRAFGEHWEALGRLLGRPPG